MKYWVLSIVFCLFSIVLIAQKDYKGAVYDAKTSIPLPYVNIGIQNKGIGTVSDESGLFHLEINTADFSPVDTLVISSIGYKTIKRAVLDLEFVYNDYPKILMQPKLIALEEVVVTNPNANKEVYEVDEIVGYQNFGEKVYGYWKDNIALGGELATRIKVRKGLRKLNYLSFEVRSNPSDSVLIRVNIYDNGAIDKSPVINLNTSNKNILYTIGSRAQIVEIDLRPFDIYVRDDFIVSLELLKVYGDKAIGLVMSAKQNQYTDSYRKYASQDKWEKIEDAAMAYFLNTTLYSNKKKGNSKVAKGIKTNKKDRAVSGFVFYAGRPLAATKVTNYSTNNTAYTNEKGRYSIIAQKGDILRLESERMKVMFIKVLDKTTININMETK
ncbi:MAG: carboxypeptidase-like regulatory domain-containing protein [Bacteroidota bacterium]